MRVPVNQFSTIVAALIFFGCRSTEPGSRKGPVAGDEAGAAFSRPAPRARFLIVGKPLVADPTWRQEIAAEAVRKIAVAAGRAIRGSIVDALAENVMTKREYLTGEKTERVTGAIFKARLAQLARSASPRDTVVLYTHSHGRKRGFEKSQDLGGIVMDLPVRRPKHRGTFLWE